MSQYSPRPDLTAVRISGGDVLPFLQSKLAVDTRRWRANGGSYGVATDINGKLLFDGVFAMDGDDVLAVFDRAVAAAAVAHLDRYVIMEDVAFDDDPRAVFSFDPISAGDLRVRADAETRGLVEGTLGDVAFATIATQGPVVGADEVFALVGTDDTDAFAAALEAAGAQLGDAESRAAREIAGGVPRLGRDWFVGKTIPLEAGLWNGVSLSKGCYLGQEVLERLFSRGSAARRLVRLSWVGAPVAAGTGLVVDGTPVGEVTSSTSDGDGGAVGMGILKRRALASDAGTPEVRLDGGPAVVVGDYVGGPDPENP